MECLSLITFMGITRIAFPACRNDTIDSGVDHPTGECKLNDASSPTCRHVNLHVGVANRFIQQTANA